MARAAFTPLFQPQVKDTLKIVFEEAQAKSFDLLLERRQECMDYYHNEIQAQDGGDDNYLKNYSGYVGRDGKITYKNFLLLEHANLTERVIDLKSRTFREQPIRLIDGEEAVNYTEALEASRWFAMSKRVEAYMNLLHDVAVGVFYDKVKKRLSYLLVPEYYPVFDENDPLQIDPVAIVYPTAKRDDIGSVVYAYYDMARHAELTNDGKIMLEEPNTYGVFNFFFPHRKVPIINHFSTPAVDLVDANRAIDAAITALNQNLHYNGFKQMVITGDVAESNQTGVEVQFALGNAQVITLKPSMTGDGPQPGVDVIDMSVDYTSHINAIQAKMRHVFESYNLSGQYKIEGDAASGYSVDLQNAKDYEDRRDRYDVIADYIEHPLHTIVSAIGAKFGIGVEQGELTIDFAEPKSEQNIPDRIAWQKYLIETKQKTVPEIMVENNAELTLEDAEKRYMENLEKFKAVSDILTPEELRDTNEPDGSQSQLGDTPDGGTTGTR